MSSQTPVVQTETTANLTAVISSVIIIMCAVSSIVFLSVGYACGWFGHKCKQSHSTSKVMSDPAKKSASHNKQSQLSISSAPL